jgi:hypothetical protein
MVSLLFWINDSRKDKTLPKDVSCGRRGSKNLRPKKVSRDDDRADEDRPHRIERRNKFYTFLVIHSVNLSSSDPKRKRLLQKMLCFSVSFTREH